MASESGLSGGVTAGCESGGPCRGGREKGPRAQHLPSRYQGPREDVRSSQTVLLCLPLHQGTCPHQGASPSSPGLPARTFQVKPIDCTGKSAFACATLRLPVPVSSLGGGAPPWAHASRARTPAKVKVPHYEGFFLFFFFKILFIFREGGGREKEEEKHRCVREILIDCFSHIPNQGPGPQPRHVPCLGIEPATFQFAG